MNELDLKRVIGAVLDVPAESIDESTSADTIEDWTSLAQLNLILALEEEFDIQIPDEEAAELTSYPLIRVVVEEQLAASP
jgi:acyl carrier protein